MKKYAWIITLLAALSLAIFGIGCNNDTTSTPTPTPTPPSGNLEITDAEEIGALLSATGWNSNPGEGVSTEGNVAVFDIPAGGSTDNQGFKLAFPADATGYLSLEVTFKVVEVTSLVEGKNAKIGFKSAISPTEDVTPYPTHELVFGTMETALGVELTQTFSLFQPNKLPNNAVWFSQNQYGDGAAAGSGTTGAAVSYKLEITKVKFVGGEAVACCEDCDENCVDCNAGICTDNCGEGGTCCLPPPPPGEAIWDLADWLEGRELGPVGENLAPFVKAGSITATVTEEGLEITELGANWAGIDVKLSDVPGMNLATMMYKITVTGKLVGDIGTKMLMQTPSAPYTWLANQDVTPASRSFTLSYDIPAYYLTDGHVSGSGQAQASIRIQTNGGWVSASESPGFLLESVVITYEGDLAPTPPCECEGCDLEGIEVSEIDGEYCTCNPCTHDCDVCADHPVPYIPPTENTTVAYTVPTSGANFFYLDLNDSDYFYQPNGQTYGRPIIRSSANNVIYTFNHNEQALWIKLSADQISKMKAAASLKLEIVGSAAPDSNFRHCFGKQAGSGWNLSTMNGGDVAFSTTISERDITLTGGASADIQYFILQQRVNANTDVTITSIKVTYTEPAPPTTVSNFAITVTAPAAGENAATAIDTHAQFTGAVAWSPALVDGKFAAGTIYTATITLAAKTGFTLTGLTADAAFTINTTPRASYDPATFKVVSAAFPETDSDIPVCPVCENPLPDCICETLHWEMAITDGTWNPGASPATYPPNPFQIIGSTAGRTGTGDAAANTITISGRGGDSDGLGIVVSGDYSINTMQGGQYALNPESNYKVVVTGSAEGSAGLIGILNNSNGQVLGDQTAAGAQIAESGAAAGGFTLTYLFKGDFTGTFNIRTNYQDTAYVDFVVDSIQIIKIGQ